MAKKRKYYLLVFTSTGPKFVTEFCDNNYCKWEEDKAPIEIPSYEFGQQMMIGLYWNNRLYSVIVTDDRNDAIVQPYPYSTGGMVWKNKDAGEDGTEVKA